MTKAEFLAALRETPRDWRLGHEGQIRDFHNCCPIEKMAGVQPVFGAWAYGAFSIELDYMTAHDVMLASDNAPEADPLLRKELLAACGLSEET